MHHIIYHMIFTAVLCLTLLGSMAVLHSSGKVYPQESSQVMPDLLFS